MRNKKAKKLRELVNDVASLRGQKDTLTGGTLRADGKRTPIRYTNTSPRKIYQEMKKVITHGL